MSSKQHHVVPNSSNGGWSVVKSGSSRVSVNTNTKAEAVQAGRVISQRQGSELIIHGKDGRIQSSNSYGNDPCPPKDKK